MNDQAVPAGAHIRLDPQTWRLMLVDHEGSPVPAAQRKAFVAAMTPDEMRALIEALLDLEIS
jgi:hypothetical protein